MRLPSRTLGFAASAAIERSAQRAAGKWAEDSKPQLAGQKARAKAQREREADEWIQAVRRRVK